MSKFFNLARMKSDTVGSGVLNLTTAVDGCLTFTQAGISNGDIISYGIVDGVNAEVGRGTYSGLTLTRDTVLKSTNSNSPIDLSGTGEVFVTFLAEDISDLANSLAPQGTQGTYLVTGGQVTWSTGYTYNISAGTGYINGTLITWNAQSTTLDSADPTNDRIDVIAIGTDGLVVKIKGDTSANPNEPVTDPSTQLKLTIVTVSANSTQPTISSELVYATNVGSPTEWAWSTSGSGFNVNSTTNPRGGSGKCIEGTNVTANSYAQAARGSSYLNPNNFNQLVLYLRFKSTWNTSRYLQIQLQKDGVKKGNALVIKDGQFGLLNSNTTDYQCVIIPTLQFAVPGGTTINQIRITDIGGSIGFYIDDISFTSGGITINNNYTGLTQDQADARYVQISNPSVIALDTLGAPTDTTTRDVTTSLHGLTPKAPNDTLKYLRGDATWARLPNSPLTIVGDLLVKDGGIIYQPNVARSALGATCTYSQIIDDNNSTYYSIDIHSRWFTIDLKSVTTIAGFRIIQNFTGNGCNQVVVRGSDDNSNWTTVGTYNIGSADIAVGINPSKAYRYWNFNGDISPQNTWWNWNVYTCALYQDNAGNDVLSVGTLGQTLTVKSSVMGNIPQWASQSEFKLDDFGTPDDNTDLNSSTTRHGLLPKLSNDGTQYLNGLGNWATVSGVTTSGILALGIKLDQWATPTDVTTLNATSTYHGLLPKLSNDTNQFLRGDGTWQVPPVASGTGHTIQASGVNQTARANLNFVGPGVLVTDDSVNGATVVTISGGGGSGTTINYGTTQTAVSDTFQIRKVLYDNTLSVDNLWDVPSIDQTYDHLELIIDGRAADAQNDRQVLLYFNNDTTASNYYAQQLFAYDGTNHGGYEENAAGIGWIAGANTTAGVKGSIKVFIPNYANTSYMKNSQSTTTHRYGDTAGDVATILQVWKNTAAINRIGIQLTSGNVKAGSRFQIIGIKEQSLVTGLTDGGSTQTKETIQARKVLYDNTLAADGTFDVSSLDQTYDHLEIIATVRTKDNATVVNIGPYFNNDKTDANYTNVYFYSANSGHSGAYNTSSNFIVQVDANTGTANQFTPFEFLIQNYKNTSYHKKATAVSFTTSNTGEFLNSVVWKNTAAINRFALGTGGALTTFATGSRLQIIGIKNIDVVTNVTGLNGVTVTEDLSSQVVPLNNHFVTSGVLVNGKFGLYWNGLRQESSQYTLDANGKGFTSAFTTISGDTVLVDYLTTAANSNWGDVSGPAVVTSGNLAVFNGTTGKIIKDGGAVPINDYICLQDVKSANTAGGTFTQDGWRTRVINTEQSDSGNHASVSSNQITLDAGTYIAKVLLPCFMVGQNRGRIYNITDNATLLDGNTAYNYSNGSTQTFISGKFTIASAKVIEIQHYCLVTRNSDGFGLAMNVGSEIYTVAEFWKVG